MKKICRRIRDLLADGGARALPARAALAPATGAGELVYAGFGIVELDEQVHLLAVVGVALLVHPEVVEHRAPTRRRGANAEAEEGEEGFTSTELADSDAIEIGDWVFNEACRQIQQWGEQAVPVAVNVSAQQLKDDNFVDRPQNHGGFNHISRTVTETRAALGAVAGGTTNAVRKNRKYKQVYDDCMAGR